ncbi:hypothetical protein ACWUKX_16590 [Mesorhizobium sp. f-mel]
MVRKYGVTRWQVYDGASSSEWAAGATGKHAAGPAFAALEEPSRGKATGSATCHVSSASFDGRNDWRRTRGAPDYGESAAAIACEAQSPCPLGREDRAPSVRLAWNVTERGFVLDRADRHIASVLAGGLRRSEIVGLDVVRDDHIVGGHNDGSGWVEIFPHKGILVLRGNTGLREVEVGRGSSDLSCPALALETWIRPGRIARGPSSGAFFGTTNRRCRAAFR